MPIKLNSTGGGSVTLDVPSTGSNFTLTAPANTSTLFTTSGGTITGNVSLTGSLSAGNVSLTGSLSAGSITPSSLPSGSRILLNTLTASSSAALSDLVNLTSAYDDYEIYLTNLLPGTNAVDLALQFHTGSAYLTTGHHNYLSIWYDNNTSAGTGYSNASAHRFMPQVNIANSGGGVSGIIRIFGINSSVSKKMQFHFNGTAINGGTYGWITWGGGGHTTTSAIRGFQMYFTSGNIASGTIKIYGIKP